MRSFHLEIVTPDGTAFDGEAESLLVRTDNGDVEILASHTDYIASVGTGRARIIAGGKERLASSSGGFLTVESGNVRLVAITFEFADEIDLDRARRAKEAAEATIAAARDDKSVELAKAKLQRALSRINVANDK
jgi:F-type H+-transporting ATPase subunit epsilon